MKKATPKKSSAQSKPQTKARSVTPHTSHQGAGQLPGWAELLKGSWNLITARFGALLGISVVATILQIALLTVGGVIAVAVGVGSAFQAYSQGTPLAELLTADLLTRVVGVLVITMLALMVQSLLAQMTIMRVLFNAKETVMDAFRQSVSRFWPVLAASLLVTVITMGGMWLLIIPGFVFSLWFMFGVYEIVLFGTPVMAALNRSAAATRKHFWGVFGRFALMIVLTLLVGALFDEVSLSLSREMQPVAGVASLLYQALIGWFWVAFIGKLYLGIREEKLSSQSVTIALAVAGIGWAIAILLASSMFQAVRQELPTMQELFAELQSNSSQFEQVIQDMEREMEQQTGSTEIGVPAESSESGEQLY